MAIDPTKVLIIVNTNTDIGISPASPSMAGYPTISAASLANAEYYATARGLRTNGNYLRMGFDFGSAWNSELTPTEITPVMGVGGFNALLPTSVTTTLGATTSYAAMPMMTALSKFIVDQGVQAILIECNVPPCVWAASEPNSVISYIPIECFLSFAPTFGSLAIPTTVTISGGISYSSLARNIVKSLPGSTKKSNLASVAFGNLMTGTFPKSAALQIYKSKQLVIMLPNGRIGYPGSTSTDIHRIVTDALWAEGQDNRSKLHLIGGYPYAYNNVPYDNVTSNYLFGIAGFTNLQHFDRDWQQPVEYSGSMVSYTSWLAGALPTASFGLLHGSGSQECRDYLALGSVPNYRGGTTVTGSGFSGIFNSHSPIRGGWSFAWQSSAFMQGMCTLTKGGAASVCNVWEPLADGLPGQLEFAVNLLSGLTMMESVYLSSEMTEPRTTVYGDPLYRPYKLTSVSPNEFSL